MQAYKLISNNIYFGICYIKTLNFHIGFLLVYYVFEYSDAGTSSSIRDKVLQGQK